MNQRVGPVFRANTFRAAALVLFSLCANTIVALPAVSQDTPPREIAIQHVTVVDVTTGQERKDQTVRIRGNRIASIAATQQSDAALPGIVDAHGGYLIPGLWDMHVHVHDTNELALYVANGVTGIRVMSGEPDTETFRAQLKRQDPSPELYLASAIVDGSPPVWRGSLVVKKAPDARHTVDEINAGGADFVKVYNRIPRDAYFALADEAKQRHIPFAGHVPDAITAQEASDAGQRSMEHLQGIALACSKDQQRLMSELSRAQFFRDRMAIEAQGYSSIDQAKCKALFDEFRRNDTWQVPTLTVRRMWGKLDDSHFRSDPRLAYINRRSRDGWQERIQPQLRLWNADFYDMARAIFSVEKSVVAGMSRSGVPLMAGTDAMNPYCFPGFSLHDELALLVESGLSPLAALQAATLNPARFLGRNADIGTVESGKIANLVLLRADPLPDIHNTTQIEAVWLEGKYFDAPELTKLLERVKQSAKR